MKELIRKNLNIEVKGMIELINKLKDKYNLILLSDHIKEWGEIICVCGIKNVHIFKGTCNVPLQYYIHFFQLFL